MGLWKPKIPVAVAQAQANAQSQPPQVNPGQLPDLPGPQSPPSLPVRRSLPPPRVPEPEPQGPKWDLVKIPTEHQIAFRDNDTGETYNLEQAICEILNRLSE